MGDTQARTERHGVHETLAELLEPVGSLRPYPGNARRHADAVLRESLERNGQYRPVVARSGSREVLAGNGTWAAARELGWSHVAVTWVDVDDAGARRINLVDNRANDLAGYSDDLLAELVQAALPDLSGTGYDQAWLDEMLAGLRPAPVGLTDPDDAPEPPTEPASRSGDVWVLGPHRLICGDAAKRDSYAALLRGDTPCLVVSDPPYGVSHGEGVTEAKAIRGDLSQAVIPIAFACMTEVVDRDARFYLFGGSGQFAMYLGLFDHHLHQMPHLIVWDKTQFVLRRNGYHSQFELVYFGWKGKGGGPEFWYGDRKQPDLWQVKRDTTAERVHSTQKPVEVCAIPIRNSAAPSGLVLDPFAGSGSTLIAAHLTGRIARLIELDPAYCDVICRRFQEHTGIVPVLEATGEPHDFTAAV